MTRTALARLGLLAVSAAVLVLTSAGTASAEDEGVPGVGLVRLPDTAVAPLHLPTPPLGRKFK